MKKYQKGWQDCQQKEMPKVEIQELVNEKISTDIYQSQVQDYIFNEIANI